MKLKFFFIIILLIVYGRLFLPGIHVAGDLHLIQLEEIKGSFSLPYTWESLGTAGGGEYAVPFLWSWPQHLISGLLANLNVSFTASLKVIYFLPILILGSLGMKKLLEYSGCKLGKYPAVLFYLINTYILLLIDGGQLTLALAYSLLPLTFYLYRISVEKKQPIKILEFVASLIFLSIFEIRIIYFLLILIFFDFIFEVVFRKNLFNTLKIYLFLGLVSLVTLLGFHAYWILPAFLAKAPTLPLQYERTQQVDFFSFAKLSHGLYFLQPHWYKNIFGQIVQIKWYFVLIPLLTFSAPILKKRNRWVGFYTLIAIIAIFLVKGSNEPLPFLYNFLFTYLPGFSLFRDPTKFFFLVGLSYSMLLGITLDELAKLNFFKKFIIPASLIYLFLLVNPVYLGKMTGLFSQPVFEKEYLELEKIIRQDKNFSRIFWIPVQPPLGYSSLSHPSLEALRLAKQRPFAQGIKGSYETFNFLREASEMGEIFDIAGIGYIAYPFLDPRKDDMHPDNIRYYYTFNRQLTNFPWLSKVESKVPLYQVKTHQDNFFITPNIWWVIGSDNLYREATKSSELKLSKSALIFAEEYASLGERLDELQEAKIVLNNKTVTDLAATFIKKHALIFPAKQLKFDPDQSGWWKREAADLSGFREFLQTKYDIDNQDFDLGGGWAVGEGNLKLKVKNEKLKFKKNDVLLARVMESSRSGSLSFHQERQIIGKIDTKIDQDANIRWFEVGKFQGNGEELEIRSSGAINVVNALAILDSNQWVSYQDKANKLQGRVVNFDSQNVQTDNVPTVTYQKINPTKYKVTVNDLTRSAFLVFSQNYDGLWKLDNQSSLPVYSLLNGFKIEKNGQYIVEFEAQKYVYPGLVISGLTLVLFTSFIFLRYKR